MILCDYKQQIRHQKKIERESETGLEEPMIIYFQLNWDFWKILQSLSKGVKMFFFPRQGTQNNYSTFLESRFRAYSSNQFDNCHSNTEQLRAILWKGNHYKIANIGLWISHNFFYSYYIEAATLVLLLLLHLKKRQIVLIVVAKNCSDNKLNSIIELFSNDCRQKFD